MDTEERWVGVEDVAAHLNVVKDSIYRWIDKKGFPAHKIGRLFRFKLSEVDAWVRKGGSEDDPESESGQAKEQNNDDVQR